MATAKPTAKRSVKTLEGSVSPASDSNRTAILQQYEAAVRLLHESKYDKAHAAFEELLRIAPSDFADRIRMYVDTCIKYSSKNSDTEFVSLEEQYDYAITLLNDGHYEDAREHLDKIVQSNANADYAFYGLAVLASMTGDAHKCLDNLTEAIRLNTMNRIQARSDSDFQDMADDPRFTELLYPEA